MWALSGKLLAWFPGRVGFTGLSRAHMGTGLSPSHHPLMPWAGVLGLTEVKSTQPVVNTTGCTVLLHHKTQGIVGVLQDDTDPMISITKLDKAPTESYADVGGLDTQIQEIKVSVAHGEAYQS